jgi:hypothetical protein
MAVLGVGVTDLSFLFAISSLHGLGSVDYANPSRRRKRAARNAALPDL